MRMKVFAFVAACEKREYEIKVSEMVSSNRKTCRAPENIITVMLVIGMKTRMAKKNITAIGSVV